MLSEVSRYVTSRLQLRARFRFSPHRIPVLNMSLDALKAEIAIKRKATPDGSSRPSKYMRRGDLEKLKEEQERKEREEKEKARLEKEQKEREAAEEKAKEKFAIDVEALKAVVIDYAIRLVIVIEIQKWFGLAVS